MQKATNEDFTYKITKNGAIIFDFGNGKKVIDKGKDIAFTENAEHIANDYKDSKFNKITKTKSIMK